MRSKQADVQILMYDSTENSTSLLRKVLRRSRADFSSNKKMRSIYVKGCVIDKERHKIVVLDDNDIAKGHGNNSESFVFDTRKS